MNHFNFMLTALLTMAFVVFAKFTVGDQHPYYWAAILASPFVIMFVLAMCRNLISGFFKLVLR